MRHPLRVFTFLIIAAVIAPSSLCAGGGTAEQREVVRELPGRPKLVIELTSADCFIEAGGEDRIRLRVLHSYGEDRYKVEIQERGDQVRLRERFLRRSPRGSATWLLTVPADTELSFSSASGVFESRGDYRGLEASSASGRIYIEDLDGRIDINTASAAVRLQGVAGDLSVTTASGAVEIADFGGRLRLRSAAGGVKLDGPAAQIEATTAAGSIEVSQLRLTGECSFRSAAGDVDVELAAAPTFDLSLASSSGTVELDLNGNDIVGTFVFSALQQTGRIESPLDFDEQEIFVHAGQTYLRKTFSRGSDLPRITLATAAGSARLKL